MSVPKPINEINSKTIQQDRNTLIKLFQKRKPKKSYFTYKTLSDFYEKYPQTIKNILININTLGYFKDWFFVLTITQNEQLTDFIYQLIIDQLASDIYNYQQKNKISTLAKWMP